MGFRLVWVNRPILRFRDLPVNANVRRARIRHRLHGLSLAFFRAGFYFPREDIPGIALGQKNACANKLLCERPRESAPDPG